MSMLLQMILLIVRDTMGDEGIEGRDGGYVHW